MTDNLVTIEPIYYNIEVIKQDNEVTIASPGPQGQKGDKGDTGDTGAQGPVGTANPAYYSYTFEQQSNSTTWVINHNLGYKPAVDIIDYGGNNIEADITYTSSSSLAITLSPAASGYAYLS